MKSFMKRFEFDSSKALFVGVEREAFVANHEGLIVPEAQLVLQQTDDKARFGYELSACQVESRIGPCQLEDLKFNLVETEESLARCLNAVKLSLLHTEVAPVDMPLDVYPDPSGRYQQITRNMPREVLLAACRVIGTHIHIGMPDHESALRVYNQVVAQHDLLCMKGNGSFGERLDIYRTVAPDCDPRPYCDWAEFYRYAQVKGFDQDPRKCWTLIRISKHGTIEFRMFGATSSLERIVGWATLCHDLCRRALV